MVLSLHRLRVGGICFGLATATLCPTPPVHAASVMHYTVARDKCAVKSRATPKAKWKPLKKPLRKGTSILGKVSAKQPHILLFKVGKNRALYAGLVSCLVQETTPAPREQTEEARTSEAPPPRRPLEEIPDRFYLSLSVLSWQESLALTSPTATQVLEQTTLGLCFGAAWQRHSRIESIGGIDWGGSACAFATESETSLQEGQAGASYNSRGARVLGGLIGPSILWRTPFSRAVSAGFYIPVIFRYGNWLDAPPRIVEDKFLIWPAVFLDIRVERDIWSFSQKIGFFRDFDSLIWMFQGGVSL